MNSNLTASLCAALLSCLMLCSLSLLHGLSFHVSLLKVRLLYFYTKSKTCLALFYTLASASFLLAQCLKCSRPLRSLVLCYYPVNCFELLPVNIELLEVLQLAIDSETISTKSDSSELEHRWLESPELSP